MERKMFELTEKQLKKCQPAPDLPGDEWFQEQWKRQHHGKLAGWGMGKRDWIVGAMKLTAEYQRGIWQGRVDRARGLEYAEERNDNTYNLGYYRGYLEYESNRGGWDVQTREWFDETYVQA